MKTVPMDVWEGFLRELLRGLGKKRRPGHKLLSMVVVPYRRTGLKSNDLAIYAKHGRLWALIFPKVHQGRDAIFTCRGWATEVRCK